jgi:hypothetical protein
MHPMSLPTDSTGIGLRKASSRYCEDATAADGPARAALQIVSNPLRLRVISTTMP